MIVVCFFYGTETVSGRIVLKIMVVYGRMPHGSDEACLMQATTLFGCKYTYFNTISDYVIALFNIL